MTTTEKHNNRIAVMSFGTVYPLYLTKITKKNRTKAELTTIIEWLTGYSEAEQEQLINQNTNFETFFKNASLNPNAHLITGMICGYRIEEIENTLTKQVRYLDKLVDELARGKTLDKILRK
jgi:hypothetical protein